MTTTFTTSSTFTLTHARYLASKIAADLRQVKLFYGRPSDTEIANYVAEIETFLLGGFVEAVSYGFKKDGEWVVALKYTVRGNSVLSTDDNSGGVRPRVNITGSSWYSFLLYTSAFTNLSQGERDKIKSSVPIQRSDGTEPQVTGLWASDKSYSNGGVSVQRGLFAK